MAAFTLNGEARTLDVYPDMPLLWAIRDVIGLTGTKFGCGMARCGACTVHMDGTAIRSCQTTVGDAEGSKIVTIEGLSGKIAETVQAVWIEFDVPQCGYLPIRADHVGHGPAHGHAGDALHLAVAYDKGATLCTRDRRLADAGPAMGVKTKLL
jgi:predicted nucleic acid-binding protein